MSAAERRELPYLFKLRLTANVKKLIKKTFSKDDWTNAGQGWQGTWAARAANGQGLSGNWGRDSANQDAKSFAEMLGNTATKEVAGWWRAGRYQGNWWLKGSPQQVRNP